MPALSPPRRDGSSFQRACPSFVPSALCGLPAFLNSFAAELLSARALKNPQRLSGKNGNGRVRCRAQPRFYYAVVFAIGERVEKGPYLAPREIAIRLRVVRGVST